MLATWRLDSTVAPTSHLRMLLYSGFGCVFVVLAWFAGLSLWHYVLLLLVCGGVLSYLALSKPILLHLSQPPLDQRLDQGWQILMRRSRGDELWQARLNCARRYMFFVHLSFEVTTPHQRSVSLTIFRDQVSDETWRQLNVLASIQ